MWHKNDGGKPPNTIAARVKPLSCLRSLFEAAGFPKDQEAKRCQ